jgi:arylsulfatase A-like enzyme
MRRLIILAMAIVVVAAALLGIHLLRKPSSPQYVIMITLDAARRDHFSCYGYPVKTSPNIDRLAAEGFIFDDAVSQASWTTASVGTIVSSQFPCQHGLRWTSADGNAQKGPTQNFIKMLSARGYETASFMGGVDLKSKVPTSNLTSKAIRWLRKNIGKKCVIWVYSYETHYPYEATSACASRLDPGYQGPYKLRFEDMEILKKARLDRFDQTGLTPADVKHLEALYDCQIMQADRAVGAFADTLRAWDIFDKSMIVIFADHGEEFLEHGSIEHGQQLYEETIRVPLILVVPSVTKGRGRIARQVGLIDLAPTVMDILGLEKPASFEGLSLASLISSRFQAAPEAARPCGIPADCLVAEAVAHRTEMKVLRCPPWKLFLDPVFGATELYDLSRDPGETRNLIDGNPEIVSRLTDTLLKMERYYPGGWFVAWRGNHGALRGRIDLDGQMIEAVPHGFFPEVDAATDSLVISQDRKAVRFRGVLGSQWKGLEIRMAAGTTATLDLKSERSAAMVKVGKSGDTVQSPVVLSSRAARVDRRDLKDIFRDRSVDFVAVWLEPGSDPVATSRQSEELRKELKAIGYIQ